MKKIIALFVVLIYFLFPIYVSAEDYYITCKIDKEKNKVTCYYKGEECGSCNSADILDLGKMGGSGNTFILNTAGCNQSGNSGIKATIVSQTENSAVIEFSSSKEIFNPSVNKVEVTGLVLDGDPIYSGNKVTVNVKQDGETCTGKVSITGGVSQLNFQCDLGQKLNLKIKLNSAVGTGVAASKTVSFKDKFGQCAGSEECCNEGAVGDVAFKVPNCCDEGLTAIAEEPNLDTLFCDEDGSHAGESFTGKIEKYFPKCGADQYKKEINSFCEVYCTQRIQVDAPEARGDYGPIKAGQYFTLPTTTRGNASPALTGAKRCRERIKYNKWDNAMESAMEQQKDAYNDFHEAASYVDYLSTKDVVTCVDKTVTITLTCEVRNQTIWNSQHMEDWSYPYKHCTFKDPKSQYCYVIPQAKLEHDEDEGHTKLQIVPIQNKFVMTPSAYDKLEGNVSKSYNDCKKKANDLNQQNDYRGCGCTYTNEPTALNNPDENQLKSQYSKIKDDALGRYNDAVDKISKLVEAMGECQDYLTKEDNFKYEFNPSYYFSYSQVFKTGNVMKLDKKELNPSKTNKDITGIYTIEEIPNKTTAITEDRNTYTTPGGKKAVDIYPSKYAEKFGDKKENVKYLTGGLEPKCNDEKYTPPTSDEKYDKKFTFDAARYAEVDWTIQDDANYKTKYPSGDTGTDGDKNGNDTSHSGELPTNKTDLDGTYLIEHHLSGLGENGVFDSVFNIGKACTGQPASEVAPLTCRLTVRHALITTGNCYRDPTQSGNYDGNTITTGNDVKNGNSGSMYTNCIVETNGDHRLYIFQIVDPENPFPNGLTNANGEAIAKNWSQSDIDNFVNENKGDNAYNPENLSYSFELTSETISQIRAYNAKADGGYNDYDLKCQTCITNKDNTCGECYSKLLTALANGGTVQGIDGVEFDAAWSNSNSSISTVRQSGEWRSNK